jgi:hypothetical protein
MSQSSFVHLNASRHHSAGTNRPIPRPFPDKSSFGTCLAVFLEKQAKFHRAILPDSRVDARNIFPLMSRAYPQITH